MSWGISMVDWYVLGHQYGGLVCHGASRLWTGISWGIRVADELVCPTMPRYILGMPWDIRMVNWHALAHQDGRLVCHVILGASRWWTGMSWDIRMVDWYILLCAGTLV